MLKKFVNLVTKHFMESLLNEIQANKFKRLLSDTKSFRIHIVRYTKYRRALESKLAYFHMLALGNSSHILCTSHTTPVQVKYN